MIFVFVVDTSPSMGKPAFPSSVTTTTTTALASSRNDTTAAITSTTTSSSNSSSSLSRLDVAKMVVEDFYRQWRKLRQRQQQQHGMTMTNNSNYLAPLGQLPTSTGNSTGTGDSHQGKEVSSVSSSSIFADQFLLLSTSVQQRHPSSTTNSTSSNSSSSTTTSTSSSSVAAASTTTGASNMTTTTTTAAAAGGGRLLVGYQNQYYSSSSSSSSMDVIGQQSSMQQQQYHHLLGSSGSVDRSTMAMETFHQELKQLRVATIPSDEEEKGVVVGDPATTTATTTAAVWHDEWGGAAGLNIALSTGLELLSRYRLQHKYTEHYGMGRLPNTAIHMPILTNHNNSNSSSNSSSSSTDQQQQQQNTTTTLVGPATTALQPACLILLTDGACLRNSAKQGGGSLQLHYGSQPLRELYQEPFRWDQRIYIQAIGGGPNNTSSSSSSSQYLHPQLRTLCEVTGGAHFLVRWNHHIGGIQSANETLLKRICPTMPPELPLPDPLYSSSSSQRLLSNNNNNNNNALLPGMNTYTPIVLSNHSTTGSTKKQLNEPCFLNGGPICCFECLEKDNTTTATTTAGTISKKSSATSQRAMLLYVGSAATTMTTTTTNNNYNSLLNPIATTTTMLSPPLYCIPESYFPNKMLDTLPPRSAQPKLLYSKYPTHLGMKSFVPMQLIQQLYRLDQLHISIHNYKQQQQQQQQRTTNPHTNPITVRLLHRDVYICDWIETDGSKGLSSSPSSSLFNPNPTNNNSQQPPIEYFPVLVAGAGRPSLSEDGDNYLNIGILHHPTNDGRSTGGSIGSNSSSSIGNRQYTTLTLLPPDPQILIPLLIRAAEMEFRAWKKAMDNVNNVKSSKIQQMGSTTTTSAIPIIKINITLDEQWKSEFRAYLFRIPPYYHNSIKRSLRAILPVSVHAVLLHPESMEYIASQCFSKVCYQKIRNGELIARDQNDRIERQEAMIRSKQVGWGNTIPLEASTSSIIEDNSGIGSNHQSQQNQNNNYGRYDPRFSLDTYLTSLRHLPAPWRVPGLYSPIERNNKRNLDTETNEATGWSMPNKKQLRPGPLPSAVDVLGDLPAKGLLAFYESRRRWIFGGPGLTIRGLHVEGVPNDGSNSQQCGRRAFGDTEDDNECLLTLAGVGASTLNKTTTTKMGEYRERLLFAHSPFVGYGSNDAAGVSVTTAIDGSPTWSVDDDALPATFFDPKTGDFVDSPHARVASKLMVNFGNPFKEKRANSLIPEKYLSHAPSTSRRGGSASVDSESTSSPTQESFDSVEEGEATFVLNSPTRTSPKREEIETLEPSPLLPPPPPPPPPRPPTKRPRSDSTDDDTVGSMDSTSASESRVSVKSSSSSSSTPPPPPPRPPAPKAPAILKSPVPPPPPPQTSHRSKNNAPPPPPPPLPSSGASLIPVSKKTQPPLPSSARPPPKPPPSKPMFPTESKGDSAASTEKPNTTSESNSAKTKAVVPDRDTVLPDQDTSSLVEDPSLSQSNSSKVLLSDSCEQLRQQTPQIAAPTTVVPPPPQVSDSLKGGSSTPTATALILDNEHVKPSVTLPTNWICVWSKSKQRWYFFDTKTNKSVWEWPPL